MRTEQKLKQYLQTASTNDAMLESVPQVVSQVREGFFWRGSDVREKRKGGTQIVVSVSLSSFSVLNAREMLLFNRREILDVFRKLKKLRSWFLVNSTSSPAPRGEALARQTTIWSYDSRRSRAWGQWYIAHLVGGMKGWGSVGTITAEQREARVASNTFYRDTRSPSGGRQRCCTVMSAR